MELIFFLYMFIWGPWEHSFILYKKIFVIAWIPHFLWAVATIRPYLFHHLYVFSIRAACTIFVHTLMAMILGNLIMGCIIDHFGWFGIPVNLFTWRRFLGVLLVLLGLFIAFRR